MTGNVKIPTRPGIPASVTENIDSGTENLFVGTGNIDSGTENFCSATENLFVVTENIASGTEKLCSATEHLIARREHLVVVAAGNGRNPNHSIEPRIARMNAHEAKQDILY